MLKLLSKKLALKVLVLFGKNMYTDTVKLLES